ncbi:MAG: MBL fold metallo-hydrolase [Oscillospiraceae bacterium]|nr:MBL fold metallo-hydrolase [Oscillospiraceae bacterium]
MARFCTLFSGSEGNCTYVSCGDTSVLIDVGRSAKQVLEAMEARGIDPKGLSALLVTHEHGDHIKGIRAFLKKVPLRPSSFRPPSI